VEPVRRPSLREEIPHLSPAQLRAIQSVVRAGGRVFSSALPAEVTESLLAARALRVERAVRQHRTGSDLRLTHLGLLALVQVANQVSGPENTGFCAVVLDRDGMVSSLKKA